MLKIPSKIMSLYDELLAKTAVPVQSHFLYKKWLRYYLDFCHKYHFEPSTRQDISRFLNKLEEKNKNEQESVMIGTFGSGWAFGLEVVTTDKQTTGNMTLYLNKLYRLFLCLSLSLVMVTYHLLWGS
jgi:hypothetical protein